MPCSIFAIGFGDVVVSDCQTGDFGNSLPEQFFYQTNTQTKAHAPRTQTYPFSGANRCCRDEASMRPYAAMRLKFSPVLLTAPASWIRCARADVWGLIAVLFSYKKLGSHCKINLGKVSLVSLCFLHSNLRILPSGLRREEPPVEFCLVGYGPGLITMCSALMQSLIFQHLASICILGGKEQHYTLGNFILSNPMRMPALAV